MKKLSALWCMFPCMISVSAMDKLVWFDTYGKLPNDNSGEHQIEICLSIYGNTTPAQSTASSNNLDQQLIAAVTQRAPHSDIITLIKQGANPTAALYVALSHGLRGLRCQNSQLNLLLEHGAKPDLYDMQFGHNPSKPTLLEWAIHLQNKVDVKRLLQHGITPTDSALKTACIFASYIVPTLINHGLDPNTRLNNNNTTPLMRLLTHDNSHVPYVVAKLLSLGASPIIKDNRGESALEYARTPELKQLIQKGIEAYTCQICFENEHAELTLLPCSNKHLGNFICPQCLATIKATGNSCPLCRNQLS